VQFKVGTALVEQKSVQIGRTCNQTGVQSDRTYCIRSAVGIHYIGGGVGNGNMGLCEYNQIQPHVDEMTVSDA
jgi:hypothetical protein